ncbi:MAG: sulfatase [Candidatus Hydrogenedentota bacterium]
MKVGVDYRAIRVGTGRNAVAFGMRLIIASCSGSDNSANVVESLQTKSGEESDPRRPNCLFIVLDTTAAKHVGAWGYSRPTTPQIDALASRAVVFENAYSQAPSTLGSTWSFLTGQYPIPKRSSASEYLQLRENDFTLAQAFQAEGFKTFGYSENPYISEELGFGSGFDQFKHYPALDEARSSFRDHSSTTSMFADATESIMEAGNSPWFSYLHVLRPHEPYLAPKPWGTQFMDAEEAETATETQERGFWNGLRVQGRDLSEYAVDYLKDSYDGHLSYVDYLVGQLFGYLAQYSILENTIVIVASDHGEAFMEHGRPGHGFFLYEELLHVPLIIYVPESMGVKPKRIDALVEMVDVYSTPVEIFDLNMPQVLRGRSLLPGLNSVDFPSKENSYAQTLAADRISVRIGDEKLICKVDPVTRKFSDFEVYDHTKDLDELSNLYTKEYPIEHLIEAGREYVERWASIETVVGGEVSDELKEEIEALGYVRN